MLADISPNPTRFDPYKNFKFRLKWDGRTVAGVSYAAGAALTDAAFPSAQEVTDEARGTSASATEQSMTLERGMTHDAGFQAWLNQTPDVGRAALNGPAGKTRAVDPPELRLEIFNEQGKLVRAVRLDQCTVSEFQASPDLDGAPQAIVIQHIKLRYQGCSLLSHDPSAELLSKVSP